MNNNTSYPTLTRGPMIDDIVTITPQGGRLFDVIAIDEPNAVYPMIYARPHDPSDESPAQWYFTTYVRVVDNEDPRA
jgi:hypothetical protein